MKIEIDSTHIALAITTFVATFLLFQQANALSSPSIEGGSNPIISSNCSASYTVPSDKVLIITDFVAYGTSSSHYGSAYIQNNGTDFISVGGLRSDNPVSVGSFHTGFRAEPGSIISCSTYYTILSWSGYLARL
jgi:hypothetical protein